MPSLQRNQSISCKHFCCSRHGLRHIPRVQRSTIRHGCMSVLQHIWLNVSDYIEVSSHRNTLRINPSPMKELDANGSEPGSVASLLVNCTLSRVPPNI